MLTLHVSNRFEMLAAQLGARLAAEAGERGVFEAGQVIVPSAAVTRRLITGLAERDGICANLRFSYLARWLWEQTARLLPTLERASPLEAEVLTWRILAAFSDTAWQAAQPRLADYLEQADPVMRYELAARVATLFEQYQTYRPDWLAAWALGQTPALFGADAGAAADQRWQAALWRRLSVQAGSDGHHPARALLHGLEARGIGLAGTGALPASAHVFCLPAMPPLHLELLQGFGRHVDVHVYALNPSREFWFEVVEPRRLAYLAVRGQQDWHEAGNRLLAAWGRQTQSQLGLLVDATGERLVDDAVFVSNDTPTVLGAVQDAMLDLVELAPASIVADADDRSLEIHVCHSLTRELEVLQDRLLGLFAGPHPPAPGEVLVVTPDLEAAAPLIDAVFGTAPRERHLPYTLTGRARSRVNAPARALLEVLALADSRFAVSAVFGLLQQPVVARRFGLAPAELDQVRDWLVQAGIHWALDADHRASFALPAPAAHSFADGLERLFLGYALPTHLHAPFDGYLPAGAAEGSRALTLGAFWRFVDALATLRTQVAQPRAPAHWPGLLADALAAFVAPDDTQLEDLREVTEALDALADAWARSALEADLPLDVVRAALARALDDPARGGVPTGLVTFASLHSLRSVPFKVVCAIGLDDGAFPTSARPPEFDLMALAARPGDRQRRSDERNIFLDLLLAARQTLHLSYTGRSVRDNAVLPPSVLVSELLETLLPALAPAPGGAAARAQARARLVVEHPLQPFAQAAFSVTSDARLRSFQRDFADALRHSLAAPHDGPSRLAAADLDGAEADDASAHARSGAPFLAAPLPPAGPEWHAVPVERLAAFFRNPCRFLLEQRLGIALRRDATQLQDDEPFVPPSGGQAPWVERLLPALLDGLPAAAARSLALASADVPAGGFGQRYMERELEGLQRFATHVREHTTQPVLAPHVAAVRVVLDGAPWQVTAAFADLRPRGLLRYRYARRSPNDYLGAWLAHLLLCASAPRGVMPVTTGVARDGRFFLTECEDAPAVLATLLGLYARGLREPLAFFPRAAWAYVDGGGHLAKAAATFRPGAFAAYAEGADAGYRLALRGRPDPFDAPATAFIDHARTVFEPLRACLEIER